MTGFGASEASLPDVVVRVQARSVNHRGLHLHLRVAEGLGQLEAPLRDLVRGRVARGHVTVTLTRSGHEGGEGSGPLPELDLSRARRYADLLERLRIELELPGEVELESFLRFSDLFRAPAGADEVDAEPVLEATNTAIDAMIRLREEEGRRLEEDLRERTGAILDSVDRLQDRAPRRLERERDRLRVAVRELAEREELDEERLAREIAYLAEKWDVSEELVRLRSHVELFEDALDRPAPEPVGKRLGFIVQEMHREANTIGAKANDTAMQHEIVTVKEEIERLREQVENVE